MSKSYVRYNCPGSSVIDYASYQKDSETLNIKFKSGGVYSYQGVSQNRFTRLCKSDSIGSYFHEFVKGKYPVTGPRNFELERTLNQQLLDSEVIAPEFETLKGAELDLALAETVQSWSETRNEFLNQEIVVGDNLNLPYASANNLPKWFAESRKLDIFEEK